MTNNSRALERWQLVAALRVFDHENGLVVGHLFDLTTEGIRLISEQPFITNTEYQLDMRSDNTTDAKVQTFPFNAHSVWSKQDINPNFYDTGFQLIDVSSETKSYITHLIEQFKATQS